MIVQTIKRHRALDEVRELGAIYVCNIPTGKHLVSCGYVRSLGANEEWHAQPGRELRTEPLVDRPWPMVVACLNIWNDRAALERTIPTWIDRVDALVIADGPYKSTGAKQARSTDELAEYLEPAIDAAGIQGHELQARVWPSQNEKRTALLRKAAELYPDALLFIVDADEYVAAELDLRQAPEGDVGWVTVASPRYQFPYGQPRLIRARTDLAYRGRHHWLYAGDHLLATHQYGGPGVEHRLVPIYLRNERGLGHTAERWKAKQQHHVTQREEEAAETTGATSSDRLQAAREALRITTTTTYDPGLVAFRLHTAINTTTPHASVFLRRGTDNPFSGPRQIDPDQAPEEARMFLREADVVHCHLDYTVPDSLGVTPRKLVIHHHGTAFRNNHQAYAELDRRACLRLVSNLELLGHGERLRWLPNPVSVARLRRLRAQILPTVDRVNGAFHVAHSPSKRHLKGTDAFLEACERLQGRGVPIVPVLIEHLPHGDALRIKARCDACFDSFWLGIQCSGIEAAAMGLPVIAGDPTVRERYEELLAGPVPYTYANDADALDAALERMATDAAWRAEEARRVSAYVETYHDDAAVALRYLDLLDEAIGWRAAKTFGTVTAGES